MIKADLVDTVYEKLGLSRNDAAQIVEQVFSIIKETLANGENVQIVGFGSFNLRNKKLRVGRNPKTGEEIMISSRRVLTFKPSKNLRDITNSGVSDDTETPAS